LICKDFFRPALVTRIHVPVSLLGMQKGNMTLISKGCNGSAGSDMTVSRGLRKDHRHHKNGRLVRVSSESARNAKPKIKFDTHGGAPSPREPFSGRVPAHAVVKTPAGATIP
jgi:hypothetical protein